MTLLEKATIMHYHRHRIKEFNAGTVEALGWRSSDSQRKRFEVLTSIADLNNASVLDVGCGYGDLKPFLDQHFNGVTYIGIDQMPEFIAEAEARYGSENDTFFNRADFSTSTLPNVDYVIACGLLGYRSSSPAFKYMMIEKMFNAADKALAFTMLDKNTFPEHPLLVGYEPATIKGFCEELTENVQLIQGYAMDDFTIVLHTSNKAG